jgi:hypothetical protein
MRAVVLGVLLASPAVAAEPAPLAPLAFFTGACWKGTFTGSSQTDTHCFSKMYGGVFVRDVHRVEGGKPGYGGETIYAWDPGAKQIVFTYYDADGGVSRGTAEPTDKGLAFGDERYTGPDGREIVMRTTWTRDGADGYTATTQQKAGDGWKPMMSIIFKRLPGSERVVKPE